MSYEPAPALPEAKGSLWARIKAFVSAMDEAASRTEADDLSDRIAALERRIEAFETQVKPSRAGDGGHRP